VKTYRVIQVKKVNSEKVFALLHNTLACNGAELKIAAAGVTNLIFFSLVTNFSHFLLRSTFEILFPVTKSENLGAS